MLAKKAKILKSYPGDGVHGLRPQGFGKSGYHKHLFWRCTCIALSLTKIFRMFGKRSPSRRGRVLPGRAMTRDALLNAELLLVRSVTPVNAGLLADTAVKFVGTATIGTDHIDLDYLRQHGIVFADAAGSNANSVTEYVVAALVHHAVRHKMSLRQLTLGVVGVGRIGSRVAKMASALGFRVLLNDPPLARQTHDPKYLPLEALMESDIITLHTPLTHEGEDATFHLFEERRLAAMKRGSMLINTCRGPVVDNLALKKILRAGHLAAAILDVWENEPNIDVKLLDLVEIGTPHIAGYSWEGKANGTQQIYRAACEFLSVTPQWRLGSVLLPVDEPRIAVPPGKLSDEEILQQIIHHAYDITADDRRLREAMRINPNGHGGHFDRLRRDYPVRREFYNYVIALSGKDHSLAKPA
jgi:erythronate-4-phosphate dehydrogenase